MSDLSPHLRRAADRYPPPQTDLEAVLGRADAVARRRRRSNGIVGALIAIVLIAALTSVLLRDGEEPTPATPVRLVAVEVGLDDQSEPYGNGTWLAWSSTAGRSSEALARERSGSEPVRLNQEGTQGIPGGFDPGTNTVIYQQFTEDASDIFLFDLDSAERQPVSAVNSEGWEAYPRISSTFILFIRGSQEDGQRQLLLFERASKSETRIASWSDSEFVATGSVGDRYASWTECKGSRCRAFLYDTETGLTRRIAPGSSGNQYAPVVDEAAGLIYFTQSEGSCGSNVHISKVAIEHPSGEPNTIISLGPGLDTGVTLSLLPSGEAEGIEILLQLWECEGATGDIYAVRGTIQEPWQPGPTSDSGGSTPSPTTRIGVPTSGTMPPPG